MTIIEIEALWTQLARASANELSGKRIPNFAVESPVYAAIDHNNHRHLLIEVSPDCPALDIRSTHGLNVRTEELRVRSFAGAHYIDLECIQENHQRTFAALAVDLLESLHKAQDRRRVVSNCLERWRSFWLVNQAGLSREAALGLFGELWFLARWLSPITEAKLNTWNGPSAARHDFQSVGASVEAKTTATSSSGVPVHFISNVDQLGDPEQGSLYLFSLHVTDDALASNDLPSIIQVIMSMLAADERCLSIFAKKLADVGYSPAHADYYKRPLRIIAEEIYAVRAGFPRVTRDSFRNSIPNGIEDIRYSLSLAACSQWKIATSPTDTTVKEIADLLSA